MFAKCNVVRRFPELAVVEMLTKACRTGRRDVDRVRLMPTAWSRTSLSGSENSGLV
jgi:hypothetical protein